MPDELSNASPRIVPKWWKFFTRTRVIIVTLLLPLAYFGFRLWSASDARVTSQADRLVTLLPEIRTQPRVVMDTVAETLRKIGDTAIANGLHSIVAAAHNGEVSHVPVMLPEDPDSAKAFVARVNEHLRTQPPLPRDIIAFNPEPEGELRIEAILIPKDSARVHLPSGRMIERRHLGALYRVPGSDRDECFGQCGPGQLCCDIYCAEKHSHQNSEGR